MKPPDNQPSPQAAQLPYAQPTDPYAAGAAPMEVPPVGAPHEAEQHTAGAKGMSLAVAIGINALILMILAWWGLSNLRPEEVELIVEASAVDSTTQVDKKQFQRKQQAKPQPSAGSKAPPLIASTVADPSATFVVETTVDSDDFGIGDGWGKGAGFGSFGNGGGSVGFFGSRSTANRVVFVVDVSASLDNQQFTMIKKELTKSLDRLASNLNYQVIFFNGPAWFAEDDHSGGSKIHKVKNGGKTYVWKTKGGANNFYIEGQKELYTAKWLTASSTNLKKTKKRVEEVKKNYGTDWRHPLKMALEMNPKPDVVYFLTDGVVSNGQLAVDQTLKLNARGGKKAKINTIAMMQPKAANLLGELAEKTGGEFTIVMGDGKVKKGGLGGGGGAKKKKKK